MKKIQLIMLLTTLFMIVAPSFSNAQNYEKYGRIAIAVVKADYPNEPVVEYQYKGRQKVSNADVMDSFRFEIRENDKPKFVVVKIIHNINNQKLLNLSVEEQEQ